MDSMVVALVPSLSVLPKAVFPYCMIECLSYEYPKLFWLRVLNCEENPDNEYNKEREMSRLSWFTLVYTIFLNFARTNFHCFS